MIPNTASDSAPARPALRSLVIVLAPVAYASVLADFLFGRSGVGVFLGIFLVALAGMLLSLLRRRPHARLALVVVALALCSVQAGIEVSLSNLLAGATPIFALAGEVFHSQLAGLWARFSEVLFGFVTATLRWLGLTGHATRGLLELHAPGVSLLGRLARAVWVVAPAAVLLIVFAGVFRTGNAIFADLAGRFVRLSIEWLASVDLSPTRLVVWAFVATVALGLFHGVPAPDSAR